MTMRLLLLIQRFHPAPSVAGVRWTAFSDELVSEGVEVGVICRRYPGDGVDPEGRVLLELGRGDAGTGPARMSTTGARSPGPVGGGGRGPRLDGGRARLGLALSDLAVPDTAALRWFRRWREVVAAAERFAPDVVVSSSPPHSLHLVARRLSRHLGVPWVVDFRDPFVGDPRTDRLDLGPWHRANRWVEARVVGGADAVTSAGRSHVRELRDRYPADADRITHIANGFHLPTPAPASPAFIDPTVELAVVATADADELTTIACAAGGLWPGKVRLHAIGLPADQVEDVRRHLEVVARPWVPPQELGALLAPATILLLVLSEGTGASGGTSTKLYQYLDTGRPILAVNPCAEDLPLLERWARFEVLRRPTVVVARAALEALAAEGVAPPAMEGYRDTYSWPALAHRVAEVLDRAVRPTAGEPGERAWPSSSPSAGGSG